MESPIAAAPFMVKALNASLGVNFILIQAKDQICNKLKHGDDPGLKSLASANGIFSFIKRLASPKGIPKKWEHPGRKVAIVEPFF